ncbi:type II secretion system F family protein [Candidatus Woesearchaeota archaeon]|nr:type II secretion system F family protein [Candidatus Woesearchaeota archaeon]
MSLSDSTRKIIENVNRAILYSNYKKNFEDYILKLRTWKSQKKITEEQFQTSMKKLLKDKTENQWHEYYLENVKTAIENALNLTFQLLTLNSTSLSKKDFVLPKQISETPIPENNSGKKYGSENPLRADSKRLAKELNLDPYVLKEIKENLTKQTKSQKDLKKEEVYSAYQTSTFGAMSNRFFSSITSDYIEKNPQTFKDLFYSLNLSGMKIFSKTYVNMIFMAGLLGGIFGFIIVTILSIRGSIPLAILKGFAAGFVAAVIAAAVTYYYPSMLVDDRRRSIKNSIPFATIHMSAVAGSGAQPITIFQMLLDNKEYGELANEIKRLMNYINLFGYNLTTALKLVANTTPSKEFSELLNGIVATIESGGDLKLYLKGKAEDSMNTYRLDRKKYVESLSTYSEIYTALLIAGPLLFVVILAIMNAIPDLASLGGVSINTIGLIGVFGLIPFLNIIFMAFLNITHMEI